MHCRCFTNTTKWPQEIWSLLQLPRAPQTKRSMLYVTLEGHFRQACSAVERKKKCILICITCFHSYKRHESSNNTTNYCTFKETKFLTISKQIQVTSFSWHGVICLNWVMCTSIFTACTVFTLWQIPVSMPLCVSLFGQSVKMFTSQYLPWIPSIH